MPIKRNCQICNKEFYIKLSRIKKGYGKFCSRKCYGKWFSQNMKGENHPHYGRRLSEETKRKIGKSRIYPIGKNHACWGKNWTNNSRKKLSQSLKKYYETHKSWWVGKTHTEKARRKISISNKGKKAWNKGIKGLYTSWCKGKKLPQITGQKNPNWRYGCTLYWNNIANSVYREHNINVICEICGSNYHICIHHRNKNRKNNNISNLQALCRSCHQKTHWRLRKEAKL